MAERSSDDPVSRARSTLSYAAEYLSQAGLEDPPREALALFAGVTGIRREDIFADRAMVTAGQAEALQKALHRRARREPLQYILGSVEFDGMMFNVGYGVLVPRPETEMLVAETAKRVEGPGRILDLCTGTGCIAIALARRFPSAVVVGSDASAEALVYAHENATEHGADNVSFLEGELFAPVGSESFDLIVSNPPYIPSGDMQGLEPEIRMYEPAGALDGGPDGLDFYRRIIVEAPEHIVSGGLLAMELGAGQSDAVRGLLEDGGFREVETEQDFAGHERMIFARRA